MRKSGTMDRKCLAEGCNTPLTTSYCMNRRLCVAHLKADSLNQKGHGSTLFRFCQQCGKLQPLLCFDGSKRSCRQQLARRREAAPKQQCRSSSTAGMASASDARNNATCSVSGDVSAFMHGHMVPASCNHTTPVGCDGGSMAGTSAAAAAGCLPSATASTTRGALGTDVCVLPHGTLADSAFAHSAPACAFDILSIQQGPVGQQQPPLQQQHSDVALAQVHTPPHGDVSTERLQQLQGRLDAMKQHLQRLLEQGAGGADAEAGVQQQPQYTPMLADWQSGRAQEQQQHQQQQGQAMLDVSPPIFAPTPNGTLTRCVTGAAASAAADQCIPAAVGGDQAAPGASTAAGMHSQLLPVLSNGDAFTVGGASASYTSSNSLAGLQGHNHQSAGYSQPLYSQPLYSQAGMGPVQLEPCYSQGGTAVTQQKLAWLTGSAAAGSPGEICCSASHADLSSLNTFQVGVSNISSAPALQGLASLNTLQAGSGNMVQLPTWRTNSTPAPAVAALTVPLPALAPAPAPAAAAAACSWGPGARVAPSAPLPGLLPQHVTWDGLLLQQLEASCVEQSSEVASIRAGSSSMQSNQSDHHLAAAAGAGAFSSGVDTPPGPAAAVGPGTMAYPVLQGAADAQSAPLAQRVSANIRGSISANLMDAAAGLKALELAAASGPLDAETAAGPIPTAQLCQVFSDDDFEDMLEIALLEAGVEALRQHSSC